MSTAEADTLDRQDGVVQDVVLEELREHEKADSNTSGEIIDIGTLVSSSPLQNIDVPVAEMTPASKKSLKRAVESGDYETLIAVSVKLNSGAVFVDLYTYEDDPETDTYKSINTLLFATGTDQSSIHYLDGETVSIHRQNDQWEISEGNTVTQPPARVNYRDFLTPLLISVPVVPLSIALAWQYEINLYIGSVVGVALATISFLLLLYLRVATRGDHPLPGVAGRIYQPDYTEEYGKLDEDDPVADVENGEFKRIITLADEEEYDRSRVVLHNMAIVVNIPPMGEVTVPLPTPAQSWCGSDAKQLIYHLSSSVDTLDRADGRLVPLKTDGSQIVVDPERLQDQPQPQVQNLAELLGRKYIRKINSLLETPVRDDLYGS